jgi:uncharacterized protein (DUF362 family)
LTDTDKGKIERRTFLAGAVASLGMAGCTTNVRLIRDFPEPTAQQRAGRKQGRSSVAIVQAPSYEAPLFELLKQHIAAIEKPDFKGKHVVIKPNMVEFQPGHPVTTNPAVIKACAQLVDWLGASKITIAEGPGHMRDTQYLLSATGIGGACRELGLPFVDLNLDDLEEVKMENSFCGEEHFYLPKTIVSADAVVSLPKMKTHHWVGMTASMKNLFGVVPGRKYGYPKNLLHLRGIPHCIMDLNCIVRPKLGLADGIVAMEGDGPINGTGKETKVMVMGTDVAAVDATCARIMHYVPEHLVYIKMAGEVIGNIAEHDIDISGASIASVAQDFARPITFSKSGNPELLFQADKQGS